MSKVNVNKTKQSTRKVPWFSTETIIGPDFLNFNANQTSPPMCECWIGSVECFQTVRTKFHTSQKNHTSQQVAVFLKLITFKAKLPTERSINNTLAFPLTSLSFLLQICLFCGTAFVLSYFPLKISGQNLFPWAWPTFDRCVYLVKCLSRGTMQTR